MTINQQSPEQEARRARAQRSEPRARLRAKALRRGLAVALAEAETERADEAARERACWGVPPSPRLWRTSPKLLAEACRGAKPLGVILWPAELGDTPEEFVEVDGLRQIGIRVDLFESLATSRGDDDHGNIRK